MQRNTGFTILELLVAMAVLVVVLGLASNLIFQNQGLANRQMLAGRAQEDVQLALLRISEVVAQAGYIFPNNSTITVRTGSTSSTVVTGDDALAVLVPPGNVYCPLSSTQYCGFLYRLEPRAPYAADLGAPPGTSGWVLVEYQAWGLSWGPGAIPTSTANNWSSASFQTRGVVADSVEDSTTDLGRLAFAGSTSEIDRELLIPSATVSVTTDSPNALIGSAQVRIGLAYANGVRVARQTEVLARSVPRAAPPGY